MFLQTPKRPTLPPTPSTKMSLPPLSSILNSLFTKLPSILDVYSRAYSTPAYTAYGRTPMPKKRKHVEVYTGVSPVLQNSDIHASTHAHRTLSISPSLRGSPNDHISSARITSPVTHNLNVSIVQTQTINAQPTHSAHPPHAATQNSAPTLDKAYAFISHSPATFPSQEPSIDNAPLARRKRRRTSPNELSILNNEFEVGSTPNKMRRLEIAKRVNMTEKAIQIWFQNKRQSLRKQSSHEKEVTELLPVSQSMVNQQVSQLSHLPSMQDVKALASTPAKVTKSYDASPVEADSSVDNSMLVLNETRKKQPVFLNSHSTSTMTFKLIPNNSARVKEKLVLMDKENSRAPSPSISTSSSKTDIKNILNTERIPLGEISANKPKEVVVENLLSLRSGSWS